MKKESYKQQESSDLENTRQVPLSGGVKNQVGLRQKLCSEDNQDAVRELSWLVQNVAEVKAAWITIESAYRKISSPNARAMPPATEQDHGK